MLIYFYKHNDEDYIFYTAEQKIEILENILGNTDIVNGSLIEENKIYKRSDLSEVTDEALIAELFNSFKMWSYSIIKKQIYSTVLVNSCFAKSQYAMHLYNSIVQEGEVIKTFDELYSAIVNDEVSLGEIGEKFKSIYEIKQKINTNVIDVLNNFDDAYFNDESTLSELFAAIISLNDLFKLDAYTFLKEHIYS